MRELGAKFILSCPPKSMGRFIFSFLLLLVVILPGNAQKNIVQKLLQRNPANFQKLLDKADEYDIQIIYTRIDRDANNYPHFKTFTYQLDEKKYYYPASTVKMPAAFLALEKINKLKIEGLNKYSPMISGAGSPPQTAAEADTTSENGLPSVAHYVKKIFLVSDNDAHNRLYEFMGQQQFNEVLREKGYQHSKVVHRLDVSGFDAEANRHTNPVSFFGDGNLLYYQGEVFSSDDLTYQLKETKRVKGYYKGETLVNEPFDFSQKNYVSLQDFHNMLKAVIFPEAVPPSQRFDLSEDDYRFLYEVMSEKPRESNFPKYHEPDHYVKFFIFGDRKEGERMPDNIRIFNKVGWAYGFLTDVSYIVDFEAGIEFFLAATIHVNGDGIFNDDTYDYETVGLPFFANLGKVVYEHEKQRKRKRQPDLSKFKVEKYD
jgi:hypothetical protein